MNFNDIFKSSFLENITSVSLLDMFLTLGLAFGLGLFIFYVYKKTYSGVMYSASFGATLLALTMITNFVTEFFYDRYVVFGKSTDTAINQKKEESP